MVWALQNPKLGEVSDDSSKSKVKDLGSKVRDKPVEAAEQSLEVLLRMFGKDGGAYLRKDEQRGCRDIPMCVSMGLYWSCMIFLLLHSQEEGDIDKLFYPVTFEGASCGAKSDDVDLTDYRALYYPDITLPDFNFCVRDCPGDEKDGPKTTVPSMSDTQAPFASYICHHDVEIAGRYRSGAGPGINAFTDDKCTLMEPFSFLTSGTSEVGEKGAACNWLNAVCGGGKPDQCGQLLPNNIACAPSATCSTVLPPYNVGSELGVGGCFHPYGQTKNLLYQCIPLELAQNASQLLKEISGEMGSQHFLDVQEFGWVVGVSFGVALVLSFIWILFLDYFAGPLIWVTLYSSVLMLPSIGIFLQWQSGTIASPAAMEIPPELQTRMAEVQVDAGYADTAAYVCYGATVVMWIVFYLFHDRIALSIGVIEEASDCFLSIPKAVFLPILTFVAEVPLLLYGVYSSLCILSMRSYNTDTDEYIYSDEMKQMLAFNAFGILWMAYVIISVQYTTIAGACADWYFTFPSNAGDRDIQLFAVERSFYRTCRYSFGSMIFGALLIAVVTVGKWVATYFINMVMQQSPENKVIQVLGKCLLCVVSCIEKFVRFLGKLAYIEVAIYGVNFCTGIYNASKRLLKNIIRFSFLSVFAHIMIFLGKCGVIAGTVIVCNILISINQNPEVDVDVPYVPLVLCGLAAALTVVLVMSVYETAIDTIMMCFLEDEAENDGKGKPSFASGELADFMKNTKSIADAAEKYTEDIRQAKTTKIRSDNSSHDALMGQHAGVQAARDGKNGSRSARARKKDKAAPHGAPEGVKVVNPILSDE